MSVDPPELSYYIISPTIDAAVSDPFRVSELVGPYVFLDKSVQDQFIFGTWAVEVLTPDETWEPVESFGTSTDRYLLPGPGVYRIVKESSNLAYGVFINRSKINPEWLIEPTMAAETSTKTILVEEIPPTLGVDIDGGRFNSNSKVRLEILNPDNVWIFAAEYVFDTFDKPRIIQIKEKGIYRVSKTAGGRSIGVYLYN